MLFECYSLAVSTVHPDGIPLFPVTSHSAALFLTNVPDAATSYTQFCMYDVVGVVVNMALI